MNFKNKKLGEVAEFIVSILVVSGINLFFIGLFIGNNLLFFIGLFMFLGGAFVVTFDSAFKAYSEIQPRAKKDDEFL
jgi:uncharacterized membrane protein